jgi:hypothetical protein
MVLLKAPRGMHDLLPLDYAKHAAIVKTAQRVGASFGYTPVSYVDVLDLGVSASDAYLDHFFYRTSILI